MLMILEGILWALRFAFGACVFSFINVVIFRLPAGESVVRGRSHCMRCGHELRAGELIPLVSYLILGRKCKHCGEPISPRYFVIESIGGAAFCGCAAYFVYHEGSLISLQGLLVFCYLAVLMAVAMIDWDTQIIYDRFHVLILALGLAGLWLFPQVGAGSRLAGGLLISVPMFLITLAIPGAFGGGDVKLVAACGWFLGAKAVAVGTFIAFLTGGIYAAGLLVRKKAGRKDHFAFGPFLAAGFAAAAFVGERLADWYLSFL